MNIGFSGNYAINPQTFGINFKATVNGQSVVCSVSKEALQDIDPSNAHNTAQQQFLAINPAFRQSLNRKFALALQALLPSPVLMFLPN